MLLSKLKLMSPGNLRNLVNIARNQNILRMSTVTASEHQKLLRSLPQLPVPKLEQTLSKYLKSCEPFLNIQELAQTAKLIEEFQCSCGPKLQDLLVTKAKQTDNWLADWWVNVAYLEYRDPVVVYSSPGLAFPMEDFQCEDQRFNYTAKLIVAALSYKLFVESGKMPVDKMGKEPLDMNQYHKIFGTCRIPGVTRDNLEFNPQSRHIVVVRNNNFFKLEVFDEYGQIPSVGQVVSCLEEIMEQSENVGPAVGVLTTENRNTWGRAYQDLILDPVNLKSVREIQTSLFLVCLDNPMPNLDKNVRVTASKQLIHGGGSEGNSANRWYDKTVQFVIGEDGIVGLTYEHSPAEGQPIAVMTDYVVQNMMEDASINLPDVRFNSEVQKLPFNIDDKLNEAIENAKKNVDKLAENLDLDSFQFECYGKEFIKSQKLSPDSFIQIAMQYAFYRIHHEPGAHYESAATRKYINGRTETIRSCSNESICFAQTMLDDEKSCAEKVDALRDAINSHKRYSVEAVNGFGVDRHLLGLKLAAIENGIPIPELFKDVSYTRSTHMRLSTSQVATKCDGFMCYAPLVPNGYGCCYNPRANDINFAVSAFAEWKDSCAAEFREALQSSLEDMQKVLAQSQKSKL